MKQKKNKGISLIVLIITIVVVIILATAIIVNLAETNTIGNANEAVVKQDIKTFQDELDLYIADQYANMKGKFDIATVNANTVEEVVKYIASVENSKYQNDIAIANGKVVIKSTMQEPQRTWAMEALNEEKYGIAPNDGNVVEGKNATINGENPTYYNPVIPVGFKAKETNGASWNIKDGKVEGWNDGLVIEDESGNEFVWVPVDGTKVKYEKIYTYKCNYGTATSENTIDDTKEIPVSNETAQIIKYGGFYVGRYEAGIPSNQEKIDGLSKETSNTVGIPVVKKDTTTWNYIDYNNASASAKKLYENNKLVKSGLLTGTGWDTVMKWIETSGVSVTDSTTWGNYSDSASPANIEGYGKKQKTGFSEYWKVKNIYDLAGNVWEWTTEKNVVETGEFKYVNRSGRFGLAGTKFPACVRNRSADTDAGDGLGFRVALYVI